MTLSTALGSNRMVLIDAAPHTERMAQSVLLTGAAGRVGTAILGGLAGALSYATRVRSDLRRMREMVRHGHGVLIIESERDLDELLRERGAVTVGSFA